MLRGANNDQIAAQRHDHSHDNPSPLFPLLPNAIPGPLFPCFSALGTCEKGEGCARVLGGYAFRGVRAAQVPLGAATRGHRCDRGRAPRLPRRPRTCPRGGDR
jgi:hypothetical protein